MNTVMMVSAKTEEELQPKIESLASKGWSSTPTREYDCGLITTYLVKL